MTPSVRWAFGSFFFLYFAYVGLVSPYASLFFLDRGFSVMEIAVLMSMLQITRIIGPFSWGWLSDYLSNRIGIIRFCACLAALVFLAIFFLHTYLAFFLWMFILHTILSSLMPLGESATVHALFKDNSFDKRYGRQRLWGSIGFIAMVLFAGDLFQRMGIEYYPLVGAIVLILLALVTFRLHEPKRERHKMVKGELLVVLLNPDVRWFLFLSCKKSQSTFLHLLICMIFYALNDEIWTVLSRIPFVYKLPRNALTPATFLAQI